MPGTWTVADHVELLRRSLKTAVPYTSGVQAVRKEDLRLFYCSPEGENLKGTARYIDFGEGNSEESLALLAGACQKAKFGSEEAQGDVLDEDYRKAGKIDVEDFLVRLDAAEAGILDAVAAELLPPTHDDMEEKVLRAEMYKLNVYGPGSFFKAHKDTPRGDNMLGSLVVVLPTQHEGGALTLSQNESTWVFDSASQLQAHSGSGSPVVAYIAFFGDVTHSVEPVTSGYRVTLTYNLFVTTSRSTKTVTLPHSRIVPPQELACETSLRALLADSEWFPNGGHLAFGLTHQYPLPRDPRADRKSFIDTALLKGCDARLRNAAVRAGLQPQVRLMYRIRDEEGYTYSRPPALVIMDKPVKVTPGGMHFEYEDFYDGPSLDEDIEQQGTVLQEVNERGRLLREGKVKGEGNGDDSEEPAAKRQKLNHQEDDGTQGNADFAGELVCWVTPPEEKNKAGSEYTTHLGNDYGESFVYGHAELFVRIPKVGEEGRSVVEADEE
ncbi:Fe2OG dioxygenase domain-containing protein [Mycena indigotica]|uniref:Fe2OG dioxygenase domain-containing protein n=1 Tax=Mycena indigotica TaxID=2126181 RepID=A0A8H6S2M3_9AGAR|nr:Fe2OG dioxygenase domain-containing protein [Mycena indigotica]KAF7291188.1 Fe2OG dioxygenase domain-containing protein [Mycena indigotica]